MYYRQRFENPGESTVRGRGIHRNLLQPPATALPPGLPHPGRSPRRPPGPSSGLTTTTTRSCPRSLTRPISQSTGTRAGNPTTLCRDPDTIDEARAHPGVHNQMGHHQRARPPRTAGTRSRSSRPWLRSCRSAGGRGSRLRPTRHRKAQLHGRPRRVGVGGDDIGELTGNPESDTAPTCGVGAVVAGGREHRR
jgi:hypothetical protein